MKKAARLFPGDTVGIVSPSWGGAGAFPHRVELGIQHLNRLGFQVKLGAHALSQNGFTSDTPHNRAQDIHDLFADPQETKPRAIEPLLRRFPQRRFVLVGDSGEKDPEAYGALARMYPEQLGRIFIREVSGKTRSDGRFREAFKDVPQDKWIVFTRAEEVMDLDLGAMLHSRPAGRLYTAPAGGSRPE